MTITFRAGKGTPGNCFSRKLPPKRAPALSVPAVRLPERPCAAGTPVFRLDVADPRLDLGCGVGLPVGPGGGHLGPGQGLRYAVGAAGVRRVPAPAALAGPDVVQAAELRVGVEAERRHHVP